MRLEITVPEGYEQSVLDAFTFITSPVPPVDEDKMSTPHREKRLELILDNHCSATTYINPQGAEETAKEFGQRILRELGKLVCTLHKTWEANEAVRAAKAAITRPKVSTEEGSFE